MDAVFTRRKFLKPAELRQLCRKSDLAGWLQLCSHLGAVLVAGWLHFLAMGSWWMLATGAILGILVNFLYAAQHELSHATVFRTRWLNELFGRVIGFVQLFPRDFDQIMHFAHHQWTQDWTRDGELIREPYTLKTYLLWLSGITYWTSRAGGIVRRARGVIVEPYIRKEEEAKVIRESRVHLALYGLIGVTSFLLNAHEALTYWILPMVLTKPMHQLQNTIEHLGLSHEDNILKNTRSTRANALVRWLCWQMPFHTAHHTFPAVPFWKLRHLDARIEQAAGEVHRMGWIEFQVEVIRKLAARSEDCYPVNEVWVAPTPGGRKIRIPAEG